MGRGARAPLIGWSLEGSAITVAPPRTGKGALIALNLLSPGDRGFGGSTVTIDPRGELWCIAARRRRLMGRRVVLLDPFGIAKRHRTGLPGVPSAGRRERDLQPARLHPRRRQPRRARHQRAARRPAHPAPSRRPRERAALLRVRPRHRRRLHGLGALPRAAVPAHPGARARAALALRRGAQEPDGGDRRGSALRGGLAQIAVERQAQVGKEEGGSNFTTIANQLAFLNYPELLRNTARSSFYPLVLAEERCPPKVRDLHARNVAVLLGSGMAIRPTP